MVTIDSVHASLRIADDWLNKGQPTWVSKCLSSALMGYLQIALTDQLDPVSGANWLTSQNFSGVLQRHYCALQVLYEEVVAGRFPNSVIAGNYHPLVFAHAAWCVDSFDLGESFITFAKRKDVGELGTPFWREYARGVGALIRRQSYHFTDIRLRGQEKYWVAYLRLIEAASNAQTTENAVIEIDESFAIRNGDKSIKDDAYQIEGTGGHPVNWDFRRHGLLNYLANRR